MKLKLICFAALAILLAAASCTAPDRSDPRQDGTSNTAGGGSGSGGSGSSGETGATANTAPVASKVEIVLLGTGYTVGNDLQASYEYFDAEGDLEAASGSVFQWYRGNTPIANATSNTYTIANEDIGTTLRFEVTPVAATGATTGLATSSPAVEILKPLTAVLLLDSTFDRPVAVKEFAATLRSKLYDANIVVISAASLICGNAGAIAANCLPGDLISKFTFINNPVVDGNVFETLINVLTNNVDPIPVFDANGNAIEAHIIAITNSDEKNITLTQFATDLATVSPSLANSKFHAIIEDGGTCPNITPAPARASNIINYAAQTGGVLRKYCLQDYPGDLDEVANEINKPGEGTSNII